MGRALRPRGRARVTLERLGGLLESDPGRVTVKPRFLHVDSRFVPEDRRVQKAKARVGAWLRLRPRLFWALVPLYRSAQRLRCRGLRTLLRPPKDRFLRSQRLLTVPPSDIEYKTLLPGSVLRGRGCGWVLGGDWDALEHPFVNDRRFRSVRDVLISGSRWQDTEEYAEALTTLERGLPVRHCWTREELDRRYDALDGLVETIRRDGYVTQRELRRRRTREAQLGRQDEISVAVGRHGDILYRDGAHRLAIAKLVGTPVLPVEVEVRHSEWMAFRLQIERYASAHGGRVPQPLLHPDLDDIPAAEGCETRFRTVIEALPAAGTVFDLAPGWGYFCQRLEGSGCSCTALESLADAAGFLAKLRRACKRSFAIISKDGLGALPEAQRTFESGLLMSDGLSAGARLSPAEVLAALPFVTVRQLFVEPEAFVGRAAAAGAERPKPASFLEALAEASGLHERACLGWSAEAGPLYRLYRLPPD